MSLIPAPSPNFDQRRGPPDMVVLHYTGMRTGAEALERLRDAEAKADSGPQLLEARHVGGHSWVAYGWERRR